MFRKILVYRYIVVTVLIDIERDESEESIFRQNCFRTVSENIRGFIARFLVHAILSTIKFT